MYKKFACGHVTHQTILNARVYTEPSSGHVLETCLRSIGTLFYVKSIISAMKLYFYIKQYTYILQRQFQEHDHL